MHHNLTPLVLICNSWWLLTDLIGREGEFDPLAGVTANTDNKTNAQNVKR
jgi:hypothetical protein